MGAVNVCLGLAGRLKTHVAAKMVICLPSWSGASTATAPSTADTPSVSTIVSPLDIVK